MRADSLKKKKKARMSSRKRAVKSQPIRKRKKAKQLLVRVAERKEVKQQRLDQKLAEADARVNAARVSSLVFSVPQNVGRTSNLSKSSASNANSTLEAEESNGSGDESSDDDISEFTDAYSELVGHLAQPLSVSEDVKSHPGSSNLTESANDNVSQDVSECRSKKTGQVKQTKNAKSIHRETAVAVDVDAFLEVADVENRAAAMRENEHFSQLPTDSTLPLSQKTIAEWPHFRLSAALSSSATDSLLKSAQGSGPVSLGLQPTTLRNLKSHETFEASLEGQCSSPLLRSFVGAIRGYHDVMLSAALGPRTDDAIRSLYISHCVAHVLRCRTRVLKNNNLARDGNGSIEDDNVMRDQGFSRARVLIILPMRNVAYDVVKLVLTLVGVDAGKEQKNDIKVANFDRFEKEFAPEDDSEGKEEEIVQDGPIGLANPSARIRTRFKWSAEHTRTFRGNVDDDFKLGISLSKKVIKLFSDFYESDIIIASPLGLRRASAEKALGQDMHSKVMREKRKLEEETEWKSGIDAKIEKRDRDDNDNGFLSSIEICVIDGANVFSMQNWDTLKRAMSMVNNVPTSTRDTDFSRVRGWYLDGLMSKFRQSIVLSKYRKSDIMALFREFENHAGKVFCVEIPREHGSMRDVVVGMRQTFFKVPGVTSPVQASNVRFKFFFEHTFPAVKALIDTQVLLVVPNYFDFVRVRNRLVKISEEDPKFQFTSMCEYSRGKDVVRARSRLFDRTVSFVAMTERFHFFWRHWIRGANVIVWFGLPENCEFYPELLNMTAEAAETGRTVQSFALYDQFDIFALERIVGPNRCRRMTSKSSRSTYLFVS